MDGLDKLATEVAADVPGSFERLINETLPLLYRIAKQRIPSRVVGYWTLDDVVAEFVLELPRLCQRFDPSIASFVTFMWSRLSFHVQDILRRHDVRTGIRIRRSDEQQPFSVFSLSVSQIDEEARPIVDAIASQDEEPWVATEETDEFEGWIARLSRRDREVLRLRYRDELSMKEIGERIDCSESRVSEILKNSLNYLSSFDSPTRPRVDH